MFYRGFLHREAAMRALWSDRQSCSHNVSQQVKRIRHFSDSRSSSRQSLQLFLLCALQGRHGEQPKRSFEAKKRDGCLMWEALNLAAAFLQRFVSDFFLPPEILNALHEDAIHELLLGTFGQRHV